MLPSRIVSSSLLLSYLAISVFTASGQQLQPRLGGDLSGSPRAVLAHSRTPRVRDAQDLGPVPPNTRISGITLVFRRSATQEADLQLLLSALQTPGSPAFHQWLSPEVFGARFGAADADISVTETWLRSQGFHIDSVTRSRDRITFSGNAASVQTAFGTALHSYRVEGAAHVAPSDDLTLPAPLAAIAAAVLHLSDFRPKPGLKTLSSVSPQYTQRVSGMHNLLPPDVATMYDFTAANNPDNFNAIRGAIQVAVVGQTYVDPQGATSKFLNESGAGYVSFLEPLLVPDSGVLASSDGDLAESDIDIEYVNTAGAVQGPLFVFVGDNQNYSVFDAMAYAISEDLAPVISVSYSICESLLSATDLDQFNAMFEQAAAQGQTLVASAGDSGSTSCAPESTATGVTAAQQQSPAVSFPASSPYVTAVGGTQMATGTFEAGNTQYWSPYAGTSQPPQSLLSYVPETAWNEGSAAHGIAAGGGGASSYFARPGWQTSFPGMPAGGYRLVPDISLQSSVASPGYVFCTDDPTVAGPYGSCGNGLESGAGQVTTAGGTSFAAPIFAGIVALINLVERTNGQGNINPILYGLASTPATYAAAFHDINSGSIACIAGAAGCTSASLGLYPAQTGYDEATGLGSVDVNALLAAWPAGSATLGAVAVTTSLNPTDNPTNGDPYGSYAGQAYPMTVTVTSLTAPPLATGTVSLVMDGTVIEPSLALAAGGPLPDQSTANYNLIIPSTAGSHALVITYPGDIAHAAGSDTVSVRVGSVEAQGSFSMAVTNVTVANNATGTTTVTVTPAGTYHGRLNWNLTAISGPAANLNGCYAISQLEVVNVSMATLKLGVGSACSAASSSYRGPYQNHFQWSGGRTPQQQGTHPRGGVYVGLLLCGCFALRRANARSLMVLMFVAAALGAFGPMGCGGGGGQSTTGSTAAGSSTRAPAATYTMSLVGTDTVNNAITATGTFTLTVQ